MTKFEKTALIVMTAGICLLILLITIGNLRPLRVTCENKDCSLVNPEVGLTLNFSKAVEQELLDKLWKIDPAVPGYWDWQNDHQATWYADSPLPDGTEIQLTIRSGVIGKDGSALQEDINWTITIRTPLILTIQNLEDGEQEIFSTDIISGDSTQFTFTNGRVSTFTSSPDGEIIVYSAENTTGGSDLWLINRDGSDNHKILDCKTEWCDTPAWSSSSQEIAYVRKEVMNNWEGQIWLLNSKDSETTPLIENTEINRHDIHWSPDGRWLSFWDEIQKGIQLVNRDSGEIQLIKSFNGDTGCWSNDSQILYYANTNLRETTFQNVIMKADLQKSTIETLLGGDIEGSGLNYDNPACNNAANLLAVSIQPNTNIPGKELAIYDIETMTKTTIINNLTRIPSNYSWTASGDKLVFQLSELSMEQEDIEIWVWDTAEETACLILRGAYTPAWLQ